MDLLNGNTIRELADHAGEPCVSLYLPTHRAEPDREQDPVRLKTLVQEADSQLRDRSAGPHQVRTLLEPAHVLLRDPTFWEHQAGGLAVFVAPAFARWFRLPIDMPELAVVTRRFHIKPLLPYFQGDGRFFVLALSRHAVRLLAGSRDKVHEVDLGHVPSSLEEALQYDVPDKQRQLHVASGPAGGGRAISHRHGIGGEVDRDRVERYLREVDRGLQPILSHERAPLVLAGVEHLLSIYRSVTAYPNVVEQEITGNPDHLSMEEVHRQGWALAEPAFRCGLERDEARYRELAGTGLTSERLDEIVPWGRQGRVDVLFVSVQDERWGAAGAGAVTVHDEELPGDEDLLDRVAVETMHARGTVYAVVREEVPSSEPLAAILRY